MKERSLKRYLYNCKCGFELNVSIDCGIPQDKYRCRMCGEVIKRIEN